MIPGGVPHRENLTKYPGCWSSFGREDALTKHPSASGHHERIHESTHQIHPTCLKSYFCCMIFPVIAPFNHQQQQQLPSMGRFEEVAQLLLERGSDPRTKARCERSPDQSPQVRPWILPHWQLWDIFGCLLIVTPMRRKTTRTLVTMKSAKSLGCYLHYPWDI